MIALRRNSLALRRRRTRVLHPFDQLLELDSESIRLDCAALHFARDVYPDMNVFKYLDRLDSLAADVLELRPKHTAAARYLAMRETLVVRHKFRGDNERFHDPQNSYLNRVLDRRVGIPISLSVIWIEVARRLEWPVRGVSFPGHFLIRFDDIDQTVLVDPFNDGRSLDGEDCQGLLDYEFDGKIKFSPDLVEPADSRVILARMLQNLRTIYSATGDPLRLNHVLRRLLAIDPDNATLRQELAELRTKVDMWWDPPTEPDSLVVPSDEISTADVVVARVDAAKARLN